MARYIDADILNEKLIEITKTTEEDDSPFYVVGRMLYYLQIAPTEEVQPIVRGKWLNVSKSVRDDYLGYVNFAECSVCHSIRVADYVCSCCGADMRKMESEEEE